MSSFGPSILYYNCRAALENNDQGNFQAPDIAEGVVANKCTTCRELNWTCQLCAKSWKSVWNNDLHVKMKHHLHMVAQEQQSSALHAQALLASQQHTSENDWATNNDADWSLNGFDDSPPLLPHKGDDDNNEQTNSKSDWLTSISEPLGHPAPTLEAIIHGASFPIELVNSSANPSVATSLITATMQTAMASTLLIGAPF